MGNVATTAERLARHAHGNIVDKAGQPYIGHIERVVTNLLRRWPDATEDEIAAACDVIEDTEWDAALLREAGISATAVSIVEEVTRPAKSTYLAWIQSLAALGSISAVKVKIADNEDNSDPGRVAAIPDGPRILRARYKPAREMLEGRARAENEDYA